MRKSLLLIVISFLTYCNHPTETTRNYYNDLPKGSIDGMSLNEKQILNAIVAKRLREGDAIVLVMDSTITGEIDTSHIQPNDTFPIALQQKYNCINSHNYYIGNILLGISPDYRYFDRAHHDSTFKNDIIAGWNNFYSRYPQSKCGMFGFSKIALNDDSTQAIVRVQWVYGALGADNGFVSLKKINGVWTQLDYIIIWVS